MIGLGKWLWLSWQSRSLPIPEVRGSNPVIGKNYLYIEHLFTVNCVLKRRKIKKKMPGMALFKKRNNGSVNHSCKLRVWHCILLSNVPLGRNCLFSFFSSRILLLPSAGFELGPPAQKVSTLPTWPTPRPSNCYDKVWCLLSLTTQVWGLHFNSILPRLM